MSTGSGIAIAGIWIGVGIVAFGVGDVAIPAVVFSAMMATVAVAIFN